MRYKAVIFDLDGLILDTKDISQQNIERLLAGYKKDPKSYPSQPFSQVGGGATHYQDIKERYGLEDDIQTIQAKKRAILHQIIKESKLVPFTGFIELLKFLKEENFLIAVASNRGEDTINLVLEALGAKSYFDVVAGTTLKNRRAKPFPDVYIHVAKELGVDPKNCIVLEDSEEGIVSAKEAGMKVIAIPNIHTKEHNFSLAETVVKSFSDINLELLRST